ncbi:4-hydroxyphenylpyruvate dioxygenase [Candidatus Uabimicrobium amorphum]|uniref:4-hydroxyphenylpyruvate dioxygenase n=1 Tax=Uabimicrobium amorphum TaxID=2596890 RepID=A0A5S9IIK9_UABAM|nr:4-hydroxyphenylpyruvate dioxygenase [Candidatus Uabimicrobium amorphum]BBM82334.1 4-hydroxyphenylpyruvate dioxygenase [Candidatus Uabimicrobium amorphum]
MTTPFQLLGFDHVRFIVGNAKQAAHYYQSIFGFEQVAYEGLETGSRDQVTYVMKQNDIYFLLTSPLHAQSELNEHIRLHGDGVQDVAYTVDDAKKAWEVTTSRGATSIREPQVIEDENGSIVMASIKSYGDVIHTFVERKNYKGFLPGYKKSNSTAKVNPTGLNFIDHIVGNQPDGDMEKIVSWYEKIFDFHRFWTADDKDISTEFTSLRSIVVASENHKVKMPINEPAEGIKKSQIQEFVEFYSGAGVQHIAFATDDIITTVKKLRENGLDCLPTPKTYYENLEERVGKIDEDMEVISDLGILIDRDEQGYLLQIFTRPIQDRPTLFFEIIQRKGAESFGKGNFKALFQSIEREQARRGTL